MRLKIDMTLTAKAAGQFKETSERLLALDLGDDGTLAALVLMRIALSYEAAVIHANISQKEKPPLPPPIPPGFKSAS
jgi:hypothetical protein